MVIGKTLNFYFARIFLKNVFFVLSVFSFLIYIVDFFEQFRRASQQSDFQLLQVAYIVALRTPTFLQLTIPFAILFAAMGTLTGLNTKMELTVLRSAGVSAWQFLFPICLTAAIIAVVTIFLLSPLAIKFDKIASDLMPDSIWSKNGAPRNQLQNFWINQPDITDDGQQGFAILYSAAARDRGKKLDTVEIIRFDENNKIFEYVRASMAIYLGDYWRFFDAVVSKKDDYPRQYKEYLIKTSITPELLINAVRKPEKIPVWELPKIISQIEKSQKNTHLYKVYFHKLVSLPFYLISMVLIAGTVTLRFIRFGKTGRMIFGGIVAGFTLYILSHLINSLGNNAIIPAVVAAWSPSIVTILLGTGILLNQEDG